MKERMGAIEGPRAPVGTDQSPAVVLVKDIADKFDKNMNRVAGAMERAALRSGETLVPEQLSTPVEREKRAAGLLQEVDQGARSRELRRELFGR